MAVFRCIFRFILVAWLRLWRFVKRHTGTNPIGLGFALRLCWFDFQFRAGDRLFFFDHDIASSYCLLPAGLWNEPETHLFLYRALPGISEPIIFVDVGASVGEFVLDMAGHPNVCEVFAFEPQSHAVQAIRKSLDLNSFRHVHVIQSAVSSEVGAAYFEAIDRRLTAAHVSACSEGALPVRCTSLDAELENIASPTVMLIDVEGHELDVLRGAVGVIRRTKPLIIFEYNGTTRQCFDLSEAVVLLGKEYRFYRLRGDGLLDKDFTNTWNCVAVPAGPTFQHLNEMIVEESL